MTASSVTSERDPEASPESLLALLDNDDATNRLLARHPKAGADLLEKLSHSSDRATRQAVASNPNTPPQTFVRLGQQFPKAFLANPALDLLLMVSPDLIEQAPQAFLIRLLKQADCPTSLLVWAAGNPQAKVQLAVAMNANAPKQALDKLQASTHPSVLEAIRSRGGFGLVEEPEKAFEQAVIDRLASLSSSDLWEAWRAGDIGLAQWAILPLTFRLIVSAGGGYKLPAVIAAAVAAILKKTNWGLDALKASLPNLSWAEVVREAATPAAVIYKFVEEAENELRRLFRDAKDEGVPYSQYEPHRVILVAAAENPSISADTSRLLASHTVFQEDIRRGIAENPNTPVTTLEELAAGAGRWLSLTLAGNPSTPVSTLEQLAKASDSDVRDVVAGNPSTPVAMLEVLAKDDSWTVRVAVAGNPGTPVKALQALASDLLRVVRRAVAPALARKRASDPEISIDDLVRLAKSKSVTVRAEIAASQSHRSDSLFEMLRVDSNQTVRFSLASNHQLSAEKLHELAIAVQMEAEIFVLLANRNLGDSTAQLLADKLLTTEATASAWYQQQLAKTKPEVAKAAKAGQVFNYSGKDPNKAALAKRPMAPVMALCSGPFVEPSRIVRLAGSTDWLIRAAVARNKDTPEGLVKKLGADVNPLVASLARETQRSLTEPQSDEATNAVISLDVGRAAFEIIERARKLDQSDPENLTQWVMDDVWGDRVGIGETLSILVRYEPDYVFPSILKRLDVKQATLLFEQGTKSSDEEVRQFLAKNQACPVEAFTLIESDKEPKVLLAALRNPMLPISNRSAILKSLFKLRGEKLMAALEADGAPSDLLVEKAKSNVVNVRGAVAGNPSTPESELAMLATDSVAWVRQRVVRSASTPVSVLEVLSKDSEERVRTEVASNSSTPVSVLEVLAKDSDWNVRRAVAGNSSTAGSELATLSKDSVPLVRQKAASNPSMPVSVLELLSQDLEERLRAGVASNPSTPMSVLEVLAKDSDCNVRLAVAGNSSAPASELAELAKDPSESIRRAVAGNLTTPLPTLESLAKDSNKDVRATVAGNPYSPTLVLECLADDSEKSVRECVALNPSVPVSTRVTLVKDLDYWTRVRVAQDPSTSVVLLEALAKDPSDWHRKNVADNPSTPPQVLEALADDPEHYVRIAVAGNPAAPASALERLAKSADVKLLRSIAANASSTEVFKEQYMQGWATRLERAIQREVCLRESKLPEPQVPLLPLDLLRGLERLGLLDGVEDNKSLTKASRSRDWLTRLGAALHPSATKGILELLRNDSDPDVARAAAMSRSEVSARNDQVGAT